jgi:hypothetical protein
MHMYWRSRQVLTLPVPPRLPYDVGSIELDSGQFSVERRVRDRIRPLDPTPSASVGSGAPGQGGSGTGV